MHVEAESDGASSSDPESSVTLQESLRRGVSAALVGAPLAGQPSLTRRLSAALVGAPIASSGTSASREGSRPEAGSTGPASQSEQEPLRREVTAEINRTRVQETRRHAAAQVLMQVSIPILCCCGCLGVLIVIGGFVLYIRGWWVFYETYMIPCDQPLQWWLITMQVLPLLQGSVASARAQQSEQTMFLWALGICLDCIIPCGYGYGCWMFFQCETCEKTNAELYYFVKIYLIYRVTLGAVTAIVTCGMVSCVVWMRHLGLFQEGPGQHAAAREGLIEDIETVQFNASHFSSGSDESEPPECPICYEEFVRGSDIKRTPCMHHFHKECLGKWLSDYGKICPLCRADLQDAIDHSGGE